MTNKDRDTALRMLVKQSQSIVFGGGPPIGGRQGDPYDVPHQSPLKTLGQLGDIQAKATNAIGDFIGKKTKFSPMLWKTLFGVGSYFIPAYGTARSLEDIMSALTNNRSMDLITSIGSTGPVARFLAPRMVGLGIAGYSSLRNIPKIYRKTRKAISR